MQPQGRLSLSSPTLSLSSSSSPNPTTIVALDDYLDLMTVIKNSQAMLGEVDTDKLISKLINSVMENTGADCCMLLLKQNGEYIVEASARFVNGELESSISLGAEICNVALPRTVINYVAAKQETIHFDNVPQTEPWINDPYIASARPKSILCAPIVHLGQMLGVLYLENSTVSVFSKSRFWLVSIICSQVLFPLNHRVDR